MNGRRTHDIVLEEQQRLEAAAATNPQLLQRIGTISQVEIEAELGMTALPADVPTGYLRYRLEDFIVEELDQQGRAVTIDPEQPQPLSPSQQQTVYAQMVKAGLDSFEAMERVALALQIPTENISYTGLKDARAITAQQIAIKGTTPEKVLAATIPEVFLKRVMMGKGKLYRGQLAGNRFTLTIRTATPPTEAELQPRMEQLAQGFPNYYGTQRFGRRLLSHKFGRLLCRGEFQLAVETYLTATHPVVRHYEADIRAKAIGLLGQWSAIRELMSAYPYTFAFDLKMLDHLIAHPDDWTGAIGTVSEQAKLWVYAYMSWLINVSLSTYASEGINPPQVLPIPLSADDRDREPYRDLLDEDQVPFDFPKYLAALPFIELQTRTLETVVIPTIHAWGCTPVGLVISFSLPAGAYATSAMRQLYILDVEEPAPSWVPSGLIDPKKILSLGTIEPLRDIFGAALEPRMQISPLAKE